MPPKGAPKKWRKPDGTSVVPYAYKLARYGAAYFRASSARCRAKSRQDVLTAYGRVCKCCGEQEEQFLTVDHIDPTTKKIRKDPRGGHKLYGRLRRDGFPAGFQILCWNCNVSKGLYGMCPHVSNSVAVAKANEGVANAGAR